MHTNIFLIGLMGVGKSTIGKKLANRLSIPFVDCDQELEKRTGVTVNTIFEIEGETGFRKRETNLLEELADNKTGVIATGGGVIVNEANRNLLRHKGDVIYLNAPIELLWSRLRYCKNRPLLQTENPRQRLKELLHERDPLYRQTAKYIVNVGRGSALNTVRKIERILRNK